ncbi:hypothetical protein D6833_07165, partial [Candidatus Parcubacteria bacterium]
RNDRDRRRRLDFLVVGAEKSGTTWLADMLRQHPQVFIPAQKELHYFNRKFGEFPVLVNYNFDKPPEWYLAFFRQARSDQVKGEICPAYLWDEEAPARIHAFEPRVTIFMILRHPVERAYSAYRFYVQRGTIHLPFDEAIRRHKDLLLDRSAYFTQVKRYLDLFPRRQVHILFYDALQRNAVEFLTTFERLLGVDEFIPPDVHQRSYVTGEVRFKAVNAFLSRLRFFAHKNRLTFLLDWGRRTGIAWALESLRQRNKRQARPSQTMEMDPKTRAYLQEYFSEDVQRLEALLGTDLSAWKR